MNKRALFSRFGSTRDDKKVLEPERDASCTTTVTSIATTKNATTRASIARSQSSVGNILKVNTKRRLRSQRRSTDIDLRRSVIRDGMFTSNNSSDLPYPITIKPIGYVYIRFAFNLLVFILHTHMLLINTKPFLYTHKLTSFIPNILVLIYM